MRPARLDFTRPSAVSPAAAVKPDRTLAAVALALLVIGLGSPVAAPGSVVAFQATRPPGLDGSAGEVMAVAAGSGHTLAIVAPEPEPPSLALASLCALLVLPRRR